MAKAPRMTPQTLRVLNALLQAREASGADIGRHTRLATGTLYPILLRLERAGLVISEWEGGNPSDLGRPRRRLYTLTGEGARVLRVADERDLFSAGAWGWA